MAYPSLSLELQTGVNSLFMMEQVSTPIAAVFILERDRNRNFLELNINITDWKRIER